MKCKCGRNRIAGDKTCYGANDCSRTAILSKLCTIGNCNYNRYNGSLCKHHNAKFHRQNLDYVKFAKVYAE